MINFGVTERKRQELARRMHNCNLLESDIEEKFVRSSGPGGQKVNKSSTCVHLKHIRSGLAVKVQKSRSQGLNRYYARKQMCELLLNEQAFDIGDPWEQKLYMSWRGLAFKGTPLNHYNNFLQDIWYQVGPRDKSFGYAISHAATSETGNRIPASNFSFVGNTNIFFSQ